jgi:serine/threonine-protein kinase
MTQHINELPKPPHEREPAVNKNISAVIQMMMAKDPARRYQKASELKADIERLLRGEVPLCAHKGVSSIPVASQKTSSSQKSPSTTTPSGRGHRTTISSGVPSTVKHIPLDEKLLHLADHLFPFIPKTARLAVAAVCVTLLVLALTFFAVILLH